MSMAIQLHDNSIALVVGVSQYESMDFDDRPSCARSARKIAELLRDEKICGFKHVELLTEKVTRLEARTRLLDVSTREFNLILFYFSGHGVLEMERLNGELHLAVSDTDKDDLIATSLSKWDIQKFFNQSQAEKKIIILDCCFAGAYAEGALGSGADYIIDDRLKTDSSGTFIMTASREDERAWAPPNEDFPIFSRELIHTLETGVKKIGRRDYRSRNILLMNDIYNTVKTNVIKLPGNQQEPRSFNTEDGENIPFAYNRASKSLIEQFDQLLNTFSNADKPEDFKKINQGFDSLREIAVLQNETDVVEKIDNTKQLIEARIITSYGISSEAVTGPSSDAPEKIGTSPFSFFEKHKKLVIIIGLFLIISAAIFSIPVAPDKDMIKISSGSYPVGYKPDTPYLKYLQGAIAKYSDITSFISEGEKKINIGKGYWIDKYEVTNAQYKKFLEFIAQNGHVRCYPEPRNLDHLPLAYRIRRDGYIYKGNKLSESLIKKVDALLENEKPVISVSYHDASAYAGWVGKKLPTVEQWEVAARGDVDSTTLYFWGNEFDPRRVNTLERGGERTSFASNDIRVGINPKGLYGMIGNAAEWLWKHPDSSFTLKIDSDWDAYGKFEGALHVHTRYDEKILNELDIDNLYSGIRCAVTEGEEADYTDIQDMIYFSPGTRTVGVKIQSELLQAYRSTGRLTHGWLEYFFERNGYEPHFKKSIDGFWMDKYEVTNREYDIFLRWVRTNGHVKCYVSEPVGKDHRSDYSDDDQLNRPNYPVVGIDWYDAMSYATWKRKRLPYWYEWEAAVGGKDGRLFPWGHAYDSLHVNDARAETYPELTLHVDTLALGASPEGVFQLAGNVAEWMIDGPVRKPSKDAERYYIKGGGYKSFNDYEALRYFNRTGSPLARESWVGFRCVSDNNISLFSRIFQ